MSATQNCQCCISRRHCLKVLGASALGASMIGLECSAQEKAKPAAKDFIDPAGLRPHPQVKIAATFLELPRPYWLGWPGTTYDLEKHQKEYRDQLAKSSQRLGVQSTLAPPVNSDETLTAWINQVKSQKPDGLLVILQHIHTWKWVEQIVKEAGIPLIAFSPIGMAFTGHVRRPSELQGLYTISSMEWAAVEDGLRMIKAKRMFEETRVLWIHGKDRKETVVERLGVKVRAIPRDTFNQEFDKQQATEEVRDVAADFRKQAKSVVEPNEADIVNCCRAYVTAKRLMATEKANALSMDCLGMVAAKLVPTPPCGAWTMLQDQGITAGCEADLFGALSMMLTSYLLDRPGYMNDPVPETFKNLLIAAHCTSGTRLDGFDKPPAPYILRNHSESALGVSTQVLWPDTQPVTLVRFSNANEMIIDTGKVVSNVQTPPAGGCRTSVEIKMDDIQDCRDVKGFHQVVVLGDHRRTLEGFCQMHGIKHVHSPRHSSFDEGGAV